VYQAPPAYEAPVYGGNYYYDDHAGRTAAIIGGSALAGAVIGGAADHGRGAVIGAVIGGVVGAAASAAANHHDRY
jgi:outer membrane lipoprotein SlyB